VSAIGSFSLRGESSDSVKTLESRVKAAETADAEGLWQIIRDPHPEVISHAALNRNLTETMAVFIAKKNNTPSDTLGYLAGDFRFRECYTLKLALCKNPKTPQRVTLSLLKFMRIFDLADLTRDRHIPTILRQKVEQIILEKIPSLPSGVQTALSRRAGSTIVTTLLERGDERVVRACLDSPTLTEGHLCRIINRPARKRHLLRVIAEHEKWSLRYYVRYGLIRNFYTPMNRVAKFIEGMKTVDLKDLYRDPKLPLSTRPFIFRELLGRGESVDERAADIYELSGEEDFSAAEAGTDIS